MSFEPANRRWRSYLTAFAKHNKKASHKERLWRIILLPRVYFG